MITYLGYEPYPPGLDWWSCRCVHMSVDHAHNASQAPTCSEILQRFSLQKFLYHELLSRYIGKDNKNLPSQMIPINGLAHGLIGKILLYGALGLLQAHSLTIGSKPSLKLTMPSLCMILGVCWSCHIYFFTLIHFLFTFNFFQDQFLHTFHTLWSLLTCLSSSPDCSRSGCTTGKDRRDCDGGWWRYNEQCYHQNVWRVAPCCPCAYRSWSHQGIICLLPSIILYVLGLFMQCSLKLWWSNQISYLMSLTMGSSRDATHDRFMSCCVVWICYSAMQDVVVSNVCFFTYFLP